MSDERQGYFSVFKSGVNCKNFNNNLAPSSFDEVICFGGESFRDFMDIIYNSRVKDTLNLPVEVLTNDSQRTRLAARNKRPGSMKRIPRPQNAFMIYRRDKFASPEFAGVKSSVASVKIAKMWKSENNDVIGYYTALAMLALENHSKKYKDYQYQPRSKKFINRQKVKQQLKNNENILPEMFSSPIIYHARLSVTSSPINEYPTPTSIFDYLLTPPSSQHSPITLQQPPINGYLPTPASSVEHSPVLSEALNELDMNQLLFPSLHDITRLNVDYEGNPNEDPFNFFSSAESLFLTEPQPEVQLNFDFEVDESLFPAEPQPNFDFEVDESLFPAEPQPEVQPNFDFEVDESLFPTEPQPEVQPNFDFEGAESLLPAEPFDFSSFQPECELPMDAPLETLATNVEYNTLLLDPSEFEINNDTTLHPEQMDFVHGYNTVNGWPSL